MAKHITVTQAEYEYMKTVIQQDGMIMARFEVELAQAKEDIKRLLLIASNQGACEYCKCNPAKCNGCEECAEWRGYRRETDGSKQQTEGCQI